MCNHLVCAHIGRGLLDLCLLDTQPPKCDFCGKPAIGRCATVIHGVRWLKLCCRPCNTGEMFEDLREGWKAERNRMIDMEIDLHVQRKDDTSPIQN